MSNQYKIEFADEQDKPYPAALLVQSVEAILKDHDYLQGEISIALVDDPTIRELNKQYLEHDYETDVISFVLDEDPQNASLVGQLIVSTDTAERLAAEVGCAYDQEVLLYVVHGLLHLVGYDDKTPDAASEMRDAESLYLSRFGFEHRWMGASESEDGAGESEASL